MVRRRTEYTITCRNTRKRPVLVSRNTSVVVRADFGRDTTAVQSSEHRCYRRSFDRLSRNGKNVRGSCFFRQFDWGKSVRRTRAHLSIAFNVRPNRLGVRRTAGDWWAGEEVVWPVGRVASVIRPSTTSDVFLDNFPPT